MKKINQYDDKNKRIQNLEIFKKIQKVYFILFQTWVEPY